MVEEGIKNMAARHIGAKFVYIGSFITLLMDIAFTRAYSYSVVQFTTRACFILAKAMLVLSGRSFQMTIFLCLAQHLATRAFFRHLKVKPSTFMLSVIFVLTMWQYFFRAGVRNNFATIRFGSIFMGFINYNFYLHGFLILLATYYSHVIGFLLIPFYLASSKSTLTGRSHSTQELPSRYSGPLLIKFLLLDAILIVMFAAAEACIRRLSLPFAGTLAPTSLFQLCQFVCYAIFTTAYSIVWRKIDLKEKT
jgi:hypothetical protein